MSSDSSQPEPDVCPQCRKAVSPSSSLTNCPECGESLPGKQNEPGEATPLSPFDDLFDEQGSPRWGQSGTSAQESLKAEEPLVFPETIDPFAAADDLVLEPLEGESKQLFDFGIQPKVAGVSPTGEVSPSNEPPSPLAAGIPRAISHPVNQATAAAAAREPETLPLNDQLPASDLELDLGQSPKPEPVSHSISQQDDPDQPLRIEGLESESPSGELASVRCRICDSLVYIQPSQLGTKVKCPECYSEVLAEQAAPRRSSSSPYQTMQADSYVLTIDTPGSKSEPDSDDEYRLSEPVERPKVEVPSHYGLEPEKADLLAPLQPVAEQTAPRSNGGDPAKVKPEPPRPTSENRQQPAPRKERWQEPVAAASKLEPVEKKPESSKPENRPASSVGPSNSAATGKLPPYWQQRPTPPEPVADDSASNKLEISLEELTVPGQGILRWMTSLVQDAWLWICFGIATLTMGFGYWCFDCVSYWLATAGDKQLAAIVWSVLLGIPGLISFLVGMGLTVIVAALMFHLGGRKQPKLSEWTGYNFNDWAPAVGFVSFAFALAALPGLLLGILLALLTGGVIALPILVALSVSLLGPLLAIGICRSDSPFGVFDSKVFRLVSFDDVDWLKYLPGSLAAFFLFLVGTLLLLLSGLVWSTFGAAAQVAGWVIFGSLTGLYSGLMVEKVNQSES